MPRYRHSNKELFINTIPILYRGYLDYNKAIVYSIV